MNTINGVPSFPVFVIIMKKLITETDQIVNDIVGCYTEKELAHEELRKIKENINSDEQIFLEGIDILDIFIEELDSNITKINI